MLHGPLPHRGDKPFMKMNWKATITWTAAIGLIVALGFAGGCRLDEIIMVDVPDAVQESANVGPQVSLRDAPAVREKHVFEFTQSLERFDENYADSALLYEIAASAFNTGFQMAIPAIGNVPGGMILVSALTGLGGLLLKRPGEGKAIQDASDAAWDEAAEVTRKTMLEALSNGNPTPQHR